MTILQNIDPLWICLGLYLAFTITATASIDSKYKTTTQGFWVSGRSAPIWLVATSAASSWLWVLGLLFIGRFSFESGPPGVFWSYGLPFLVASAMFGYFGKILLEKFNNKYKDLLPEQKRILKEFITSVNSGTRLRNIVNKELDTLSGIVSELAANVDNQVVKIKLDEVSKAIKPVSNKERIDDNHLVKLMQYYELVNELKKL